MVSLQFERLTYDDMEPIALAENDPIEKFLVIRETRSTLQRLKDEGDALRRKMYRRFLLRLLSRWGIPSALLWLRNLEPDRVDELWAFRQAVARYPVAPVRSGRAKPSRFTVARRSH